jgi:uncharacterized membrane protein
MNWPDLFVRPVPSNRDTDPRHWKLLFFYYNPDNPRLLVPQRWTGNPFTVNFARPSAWIVAAMLLVLIVVLVPFDHDLAGFLKAIRHLITNG